MQTKPLVIGLTGGIASGKSFVSHVFKELGIDVIDTDHLAREVVAKGEPALEKIVAYFGSAVLIGADLNRRHLRKIIFEDAAKRKWLEALLHPLIRDRVSTAVAQVTSPYCIVVIPLLVETLPNPVIDRILVVDIDEARQRQFLAERDHLAEAEIDQILQSQATQAVRLAKADDLLHNTGSLELLHQQVLVLHGRYLALAMSQSPPPEEK